MTRAPHRFSVDSPLYLVSSTCALLHRFCTTTFRGSPPVQTVPPKGGIRLLHRLELLSLRFERRWNAQPEQ